MMPESILINGIFNFEIIMSKGAHLLYGETQPVKKERDDSEMFGSLHKLSSGKTKRK